MERIDEVFEVFKDYYGEDRVDLQDYDDPVSKLIVHFPEVTVTNEHDEHVNITDLYVKIQVDKQGTMYGLFQVTRGSYTLSQVYSNYCHSHVRHIPTLDYEFSEACVGSGPIKTTMSILNANFDLDKWKLFCYELDKFTQVESIKGVPYRRLHNISRSCLNKQKIPLRRFSSAKANKLTENNIPRDFLKNLFNNNPFSFCIACGRIELACSYLEYLSIITTAFKKWLINNNVSIKTYFDNGTLLKGTFDGTDFVTLRPDNYLYTMTTNPAGKIACIFKGELVIITVTDDLINTDDSKDILMNPHIAMMILNKMINVLNYARITNSTSENRFQIL